MANTLGITEATLAQARALAGSPNLIGDRERWDQSETIRISDHADNDALEVGDDTSKMALFVSKTLGAPWVQNKSKHGGQIQSAGNDAATDPVAFPV